MSARDEVIEALAAFARATDVRDWTEMSSSLTEDVQGYGAQGRDAVVAQMRRFLGGVGPSQHLLGNHRVEIDGDTARVACYGRVHHVGSGPMAGSSYECLGDYADTWVQRDGRWLLAKRWFEIRIEIGDRAVLRPAD